MSVTSDEDSEEIETVTVNEALRRLTAKYGYSLWTVRDETGRRYKFRGLRIGDADTQWIRGREQSRWTETSLYVTDKGKYVVSVTNITLWQGETNSYRYSIHDSLDDVENQDVLDDMWKYLRTELGVEIDLGEVARELTE
jgi:hypothetical protein